MRYKLCLKSFIIQMSVRMRLKIKPKIQNADEDEELDTDELLSILKLPTKIGDIIYPLIDQEEGSPVIFRFKGKGTRPGKYNDLLIMYPLVSYQMVKISRSSGALRNMK